MSWISWNCRGLAAALTIRELKGFCSKYKSSLVFLFETRAMGHKIERPLVISISNHSSNFIRASVEDSMDANEWEDRLHPLQQQHMNFLRHFVSDMGLMDVDLKGLAQHSSLRLFGKNTKTVMLSMRKAGWIQSEILRLLNSNTMDFSNHWGRIQELGGQIDMLRKHEDIYWVQRSRLKWLQYADKNLKFFHAFTIQIRDKNKLYRLKDTDGNWVEGQTDIERLVLDHYGRYLGLPAEWGKSRVNSLALIRDRILQKIDGWNKALLNQAGKEVLIKVVLQAILAYAMSVVRFPKKMCKRICSQIARSVPCKTTQSVSYTNSTRHGKSKHDIHPVFSAQSDSPSQASRSWGAYVVPAAVLGFAGLAAFFHYNDERRAVPKGHEGNSRTRKTVDGPIIGGPFRLINTEKQTVTERNFLGNWVLLYFGYTSSPDIGPEQVQIMAKAIDILGLALLSQLTVEEDGGDYLVESSHNMYLLNPNMEVVRCFGVEYNAEELSEAIWKELNRKPS
ncbi:Thioredoxin-like superfamily [Sesbania bispinosa]|nr:Thioredoxin-like superfamily [Sesbania bispinosa]